MTLSRDSKFTTGTHHDSRFSKWDFLAEERWNKHTETKTVKFDEVRYVLMSDLNWVTDVETDIYKSGVV